jgi:hypothetical protein
MMCRSCPASDATSARSRARTPRSRSVVLALRQLRDVVGSVAQGAQLAATGQRDRIVEKLDPSLCPASILEDVVTALLKSGAILPKGIALATLWIDWLREPVSPLLCGRQH